MRIDVLLNKLCLTKTRNVAKTACDKNLVSINGKTAKASHEVKAGDTVTFDLYGYRHIITILEIPGGNVAKKDVSHYYSLVEKTLLD